METAASTELWLQQTHIKIGIRAAKTYPMRVFHLNLKRLTVAKTTLQVRANEFRFMAQDLRQQAAQSYELRVNRGWLEVIYGHLEFDSRRTRYREALVFPNQQPHGSGTWLPVVVKIS